MNNGRFSGNGMSEQIYGTSAESENMVMSEKVSFLSWKIAIFKLQKSKEKGKIEKIDKNSLCRFSHFSFLFNSIQGKIICFST